MKNNKFKKKVLKEILKNFVGDEYKLFGASKRE